MAKPVVIVGAGLAGLTCARALHRAGVPVLLVDAADRPGGRLKTDRVDGFRLDHGFQVHFTAYPAASEELDYDALDFRRFEPGALIATGKDMALVHRSKPIQMALSTFLPLSDKTKILAWTRECREMSLEEVFELEDIPTEKHLKRCGFSDTFLEKFARPFFGGIFLDRGLGVSLRQFAFVWKMLDAGDTVVPSQGIEAIPKQIAASIPASSMRMKTPIARLVRTDSRAVGVETESGERIEGDSVVIATEAPEAERLAGQATVPGYRSSICLYFAAETAPIEGRYLVLNGTGKGIVNEIVPMTNVAPELSETGEALISATILGHQEDSDESLADAVRTEAREWFPGVDTARWRFIRAYRIRYAQMPQQPGVLGSLPANRTAVPGLYFAGEFTVNSSIHGAIHSGRLCAQAILEDRRRARSA
ncbi:MAG: NAD(P)/FAD-dependent oxidoreductase [Fimbriimonadaceae bacterium]